MNAPMPAQSSRLAVYREHIRDVWDQLQPLLARHWREIAHYQDIPLDPDRQRYEIAEASGTLRVFLAYLGEDLIGYAVFIVSRSMHYAGSVQAVQDVIYLDPAYRNAGIGRALVAECDEALRAEGVQVVYQHVKLAYDFGPLLASLGYEAIETVYGRRLDRH